MTDRGFLKSKILHFNFYFNEALGEVEAVMRRSLKAEAENLSGKWLESPTDKPNQSLMKHWEEVKQSMNCWQDLATVSRNTEKQ